jgi:hypothetical protein
MKYREIIADNLSKAGWSWGCASAVDSHGRTIFVADAHCDNGQRFIVSADEKLTAFLELERVTHESGRVPELGPLGGIMISADSTALKKKLIR